VDLPLLGQFSVTLPLIVLLVARAADGLTGGNISVAKRGRASRGGAGLRR
jgi:hypothetical protein